MANKILKILFDQDAECPMDNDDGAWTLVAFGNRSIHYENPNKYGKIVDGQVVPANIGLLRKFKVGLAHWLDYYEHGLGMYSLAGEGTQCRWDTSNFAGILLWNHKPNEMGAKTVKDRQKDARAFLETYNNWMNGQVVGFILEDEKGNDIDSCFGFYEPEYMSEEIARYLEAGDKIKLEGEAYGYFDTDKLPKGVEIVDDFEEQNETVQS